jgi:hypothetical protein
VRFFGKHPFPFYDKPLLTADKRQDLNSSVMTGSDRVVDHTTFAELQWRRDPFLPNLFVLSPGFQARSHLLSEEFVEVLKDIHALQCLRDSPDFAHEDNMMMANCDSQHASIESRLAGLERTSFFTECCYLAAYLCTCMMCCKVYRQSAIPVRFMLKIRISLLIRDLAVSNFLADTP